MPRLSKYIESAKSIRISASIPDSTSSSFAEQTLGSSVAIVGISCRFPGANNLDEFWKLRIEGQDAISVVPEGRWTPEKCPVLPDDAHKSQGGFLKSNLCESNIVPWSCLSWIRSSGWLCRWHGKLWRMQVWIQRHCRIGMLASSPHHGGPTIKIS
jgi:hypothetical protein